ncbi:MAG: S41 family peptidase [Simkaniaceae bacterium]|nr:S41 family peptidase [Simkaniaceae bacterium]
MIRTFFTLLFLLVTLQAKPPELTPHDAKLKIDEILSYHIQSSEFEGGNHSNTFITSVLEEFTHELDPSKSYLLKGEVKSIVEPDEKTLNRVREEFKKENFSIFSELTEKMVAGIERHRRLEKRVAKAILPEDVEHEEFIDMEWVDSEEALFDRMLRIRALQIQTSQKLGLEDQDKFVERLKKNRLAREEEILGKEEGDKLKQMLAFVIKAVCNSLDSHTTYFTPQEASQFLLSVQQRLVGIGAELRDELTGFKIMRLLDGGPAKRCKEIKEGDQIIAVNREPVIGYHIIDAVSLIRGQKGSKVTLTMLRGEETFDVEIERDEIVLDDFRIESSSIPFGAGSIGYIRLYSFYQDPTSSSADDITKCIENFKKENKLLGVVLDLRENAGGLLSQAVSVCGLFVKQGIMASIKDNFGEVHHLRNFNKEIAWDGPLMILTNCATASAAEIVSGTLRDYGRAVVVGDTYTFGKGSYQSFTLDAANNGTINPQGEYKVTRGIYYTVSGKSPQLVGYETDVVIPGPLSTMKIGERFDKKPVPNDQIDPNFEDDLSDIHPLQRLRLRKFYQTNMQKKSTELEKVIPTLQANAQKRIELNKTYQNFLKLVDEKEPPSSREEMESFAELQKEEAFSAMKDLIVLTN